MNILSALLLVTVVLVQQGRGAEMGSSFGRGASGSLVGVTGTSNPMSRITSLIATVFFATALSLSLISADSGDSVLERIDQAVENETPALEVNSGDAAAEPDVELEVGTAGGQDNNPEVPITLTGSGPAKSN